MEFTAKNITNYVPSSYTMYSINLYCLEIPSKILADCRLLTFTKENLGIQ